jgi:two-component system, sensor histidine kinase and response regulator
MKRILVIDDADFILESTSTLLRFEGYDVVTAGDGIAGVDAVINHKPDLVLCDISMPGLDGYGVLERMRAIPETATTPFIFLTAFTEKANMRAGMERGADDFLVKPYSRDELIAAIEAQWSKHNLIEMRVREKVDLVGRNVTYALPHEFRTVLNQVIGSARYLRSNSEEIQPEDIVEISDDIITSSERLLKITESFLIYIQIQSFENNLESRRQLRGFRTDEPGAVIADIAENIAYGYGRAGDLHIDEFVENLSIEVSTENFNKLSRELIDNAFRFSEKGTPVKLRMWVANDSLFISLADYGRGMTHKQINNVGAYVQFERTIYEQQGVGLGLVIAKKLIELHDGSFGILSEEGKGTSITFSLPCTIE